jgi:hypothetical protein
MRVTVLGACVRRLSASRARYLAFCVAIAGTMAAAAAGAFSVIRTSPRFSGVLVPRESTLTWESPNADGPIVAEYAELHFVLDNTGRRPVKVLGVDATCGCVKPVADPPDVRPGETTKIAVKAITPATGTRVLPLVVHTDSPIIPDVRLIARMVVRRKPPFLYGVTGDLNFRGRYSPALVAEFSIVTFESVGPIDEPKVSTDLPFLRIARDEVSNEARGAREADDVAGPFIVRTRRYTVGFKEAPPEPTFIGTITVNDPFGRTGSRSLNVLGQLDATDAPKVTPRSLTLHKKKGAWGSFVVICNEPSRTVTCSIDDNRRADLTIRCDSDDPTGRIHRIEVAIVDPTHLSDGPVRLQIRESNVEDKATVLLHVVP